MGSFSHSLCVAVRFGLGALGGWIGGLDGWIGALGGRKMDRSSRSSSCSLCVVVRFVFLCVLSLCVAVRFA